VLTVLDRGKDLDQAEIEGMLPHFILALVLIPAVIGTAILSVVIMRRRLRHAGPPSDLEMIVP
jgi:hypothetical protein